MSTDEKVRANIATAEKALEEATQSQLQGTMRLLEAEVSGVSPSAVTDMAAEVDAEWAEISPVLPDDEEEEEHVEQQQEEKTEIALAHSPPRSRLEVPSKKERGELFRKMDYNGNGGLSLAELTACVDPVIACIVRI
jgi:hypothetical protein